MENVNNTNATENAAGAADQNQVQNNVPTPPANEQAAQASEEKPKKKGLIKKILMIIGAIIALFTGGLIVGRVTGNKSDNYDNTDTESNDPQITEF